MKKYEHRNTTYIWLDDDEYEYLFRQAASKFPGFKTRFQTEPIIRTMRRLVNGRDITEKKYPKIKKLLDLNFQENGLGIDPELKREFRDDLLDMAREIFTEYRLDFDGIIGSKESREDNVIDFEEAKTELADRVRKAMNERGRI